MDKNGCLIAFTVMMVIGVIMQGVDLVRRKMEERELRQQESAQKQASERESREQMERRKREEVSRENELRLFALREAPELWGMIEELNAQIDSRHRRTDELLDTLVKMGINPESDEDYLAAMKEETGLCQRLEEVRATLKDAYVASAKFKAATSTRESRDIKNTGQDGIDVADSIRKRYEQMKNDK